MLLVANIHSLFLSNCAVKSQKILLPVKVFYIVHSSARLSVIIVVDVGAFAYCCFWAPRLLGDFFGYKYNC